METVDITVPRKEARELYQSYKAHLHYSQPMDREIMRAYQLIAQGRVIIKALESIKKAGVNAEHLPKLALCRADVPICTLEIPWGGGACSFNSVRTNGRRWSNWSGAQNNRFVLRDWPEILGASARRERRSDFETIVPPVPLNLRPKRGLANYHILWEVEEWKRVPPSDPYLLRRIGKGDLWVVLAMWDLTPIEKAVLSSRLMNA